MLYKFTCCWIGPADWCNKNCFEYNILISFMFDGKENWSLISFVFRSVCMLTFPFFKYLLVLNLALYSIYFFMLCLPLIPILKQGWHIQDEYSVKIKRNRTKDAIEYSPMSFLLQQHSFVINLGNVYCHVFSDCMWPCSSFQYSWACIHVAGRLW